MKKLIRLSKSCISNLEKKSVERVLSKEYLGMGDEVQVFEKKLKKILNRPVVCVNSGTAALHLALQACGIGVGDEVLVPSITYISSFQSISATGAKAIPCDVNENNLIISLKDSEKRLTKKTKAIMPVHFSGSVGELDKLYKFAKKYNLRVIEDAAHAFGTIYKKKVIGSFGDITCFSFDGIKNITSGEGGCLVTNDKKIIQASKDARLLGVINDTDKRFSARRSWDFDVKRQGWRYHMSNINAAIGIAQLKRFKLLAKQRQNSCKYYDSLFKKQNKIMIFKRNYDLEVPHIYVVKINKMKNRNNLRKKLIRLGIQTGIHYFPNHKLSKYKLNTRKKLKITDKIYKKLLTLPLHPDISKNDIRRVVNSLSKVSL